MTKTRTIIAAVAMLAVLLLAGACSSGGNSSKNAATSGGSKTVSSAKASSKSTGSDKSDSAFCKKAKRFTDEDSGQELSSKDAIKALKDLKNSAPSEIKGDLQTLIDIAERLSNIDTTDPSALASLGNLDTDKIDAAGKHVEDYVKQHCGFTLES